MSSQPAARPAARSTGQLTPEQRVAVSRLAATDQHVRLHEQAHLAAAGAYATSGAAFTYTVGPDGQRYATAGEVSLDVSPDPSDPEKTIQKARVIQAAATAPPDPSSQDRKVAAEAVQMILTAQQQLSQQVATAYRGQDANQTGRLLSVIA